MIDLFENTPLIVGVLPKLGNILLVSDCVK